MVDMQLLNSFPAPFQAQEAPPIFDKKPYIPDEPLEQMYEHTQIGTTQIFFAVISGVAFLLAAVLYYGWWIMLVGIAVIIVQLAFRGTLTVMVDDDALSIQYGPLTWGVKSWPVAEIASVSVVKLPWNNISRLLGGKIYDVSGSDAVSIRLLNGKTVRIGTDEPEEVRQAIENRRV
jgi:uncharacterized membrane protein YdbT with pleckstrin-like domain